MHPPRPKTSVEVRRYFNVYVAVTLAVVAYVLGVFVLYGGEGIGWIVKSGPITNLWMTLFFVSTAWLLFGSILLLQKRNTITRQNVITYSLFYLLAFIYLNFLREKVVYGDVFDYVRAAHNLCNDQPFHSRYLYPPFFATCLQSLVPLGDNVIVFICMAANYFSLLVFYVLTTKLLVRYGLSSNYSAIAVFIALCANVPVIRTLGYVQVNLHVANLVLLNLLFYRRRVLFSAVALGLAVHLKFSPIVLVLPFVLIRDWKWLTYFIATIFAIGVWTSVMNSPDYYLNFVNNAFNILNQNTKNIFGPAGFSFRDSSIDGLVRAISAFLKIESGAVVYLGLLFRICVLAFSGFIILINIKLRTYYDGDKREATVYNSYVVMLFLMTILSPVVWVYHYVFVIPAFLIMLKKLHRGSDVFFYLLAYFLIYLMPTFDVFPVSYNRLVGVSVVYVLFMRFLKPGGRPEESFRWIRNTFGKFGSLVGQDPKG